MTSPDSYNIETYLRDINNAAREAFLDGPVRVGGPAPNFRMPKVDGGAAELSAILSESHAVLIFGCFTAPPCIAQLPILESLHRTYAGRGISFLFVYTREIHPGENFPPHRTIEQKLDQATRMRDYARISFAIAIDDLLGTVHQSYGGLPSMACVVHRSGTLVYRGSWTHAETIHRVLENLLRRDRAEAAGRRGRFAYHEWLSFIEHEGGDLWSILDIAGPKARADYERANG